MRLLVLTSRPELATNRRLLEAAAARGARLELVDATALTAVNAPVPRLLEGGRDLLLEGFDAALARVGNWRPDSVLAALEVVSAAAVATPNPAPAVRCGRDHWRTALALARAGLPTPVTIAGSDPEVLAAAGEELGLPVVVKQRRSRMGVGVILCRRRDHLEAVLDSLWRVGDEVVVQQFLATGGVSLRLLVVDGRVVAAARFVAAEGEWRSNAARGGAAAAYRPSDAEARLASAAAAAVGLGLCGVDLLSGPDGPVVGEVNPTPGFARLEAATGADVAGAIVDGLLALSRRADRGSGPA